MELAAAYVPQGEDANAAKVIKGKPVVRRGRKASGLIAI
jgi:hypothetical protein